METLSKPFEVSGHEVVTSASVGVAVAETGEESASDLVRDADSAMYRAKEMGGGRLELFDPGLRERLLERASIEHDLRHALERDELELHYQPLVDLTSARTVGFEALLRWRHPERGLVPPNDFISIAEETGLIIPIGSWVLRAACAQLARWEEPVYLSANLSALQVVPDLVDEVEGLARALHAAAGQARARDHREPGPRPAHQTHRGTAAGARRTGRRSTTSAPATRRSARSSASRSTL